MKRFSTTAAALRPTTLGAVGKAWDEVSVSFDRFCLAARIESLMQIDGIFVGNAASCL
jgi:hypothetical protein